MEELIAGMANQRDEDGYAKGIRLAAKGQAGPVSKILELAASSQNLGSFQLFEYRRSREDWVEKGPNRVGPK